MENIDDEKEFKKLNKKKQEEAKIIIKLVRDADKLENIEFAVFDKMKIAENFSKWMKYDYEDGGISEKILSDFLDGKCCAREDKKGNYAVC
ncbi:MAG: hypothetical protein N4A38_02250 [Candidatus Gracilibacteria bacterium]|nr:hypothetical protein [Candidatus Gracilibacteria bacterium]